MPNCKTLFVVPSLTRAGAEKQVVDLVNGLSELRFQCHVASFEENRDQLDRINLNSVVYHRLSRTKKFDLGLVRSLAQLIDNEEFDILHCTLSIAIFYGALAILFSKRKPSLVAGVHTTISRTKKDEFIERWLYRWILRSAAKVVFVCHRQKEYWIARDPALKNSCEVIYNGVDPDYFLKQNTYEEGQLLREKLGISSQDLVCCCIAAFRPEKAQGNILLSLKNLSGKFNSAHLIYAGEGAEKQKVEKLALDSGLQGQVHFLGNIPDVRPVLAASDFSIISSVAVETFSFAMLESMSMGTPVLSSRIGGADEAVIPGETGYLVEPGNIQELTEAMNKLLENSSATKALGVNAREKVELVFSMETMIEKTGELLVGITTS